MTQGCDRFEIAKVPEIHSFTAVIGRKAEAICSCAPNEITAVPSLGETAAQKGCGSQDRGTWMPAVANLLLSRPDIPRSCSIARAISPCRDVTASLHFQVRLRSDRPHGNEEILR